MLSYAATYHVRIITINSREYPGSSKFNPEELSQLGGDVYEDHVAVTKGLGTELATFLFRYIQANGIPKIALRAGRRTGGLVVVAWSLGNATLLSFLAHASNYPGEIQACLEMYLRTVIMYGEWDQLLETASR